MLPDRGPELTRHLDAYLYQVPAVALEVSARALRETTRALLATLQDVLANPAATENVSARQSEVDAALARIQVFFAGISHESDAQTKPALRVAQLPAMAARDLKQRQVEGQAGPEDALHILDALRWLERVAHHTWRIGHYLSLEADAPAPPDVDSDLRDD